MNTRKPNAAAPLTVDIGNGTFIVPMFASVLTCDGTNFTGNVHFRGNGASNSIIQLGQTGDFQGFFEVSGCSGMSFSNLDFVTNAKYGYIIWENGGSSRWDNVEVHGKGGAWSEQSCGPTEGTHYWYSSKLTSEQSGSKAETYRAACDKSWIFGSEVTSTVTASLDGFGNTGANYNTAVNAVRGANTTNSPEIHLYGSNIRAISYSIVRNSIQYPLGTVHAGNGGIIHIHGTGIDSISQSGQDIYVMTADSGGFIHANASAYVIQTTGTATRITNSSSTIKAPYMWEQSDTPPTIVSVNGADSFVDTAGAYPMTYVYNDGCLATTGSPWISATGQCLQ